MLAFDQTFIKPRHLLAFSSVFLLITSTLLLPACTGQTAYESNEVYEPEAAPLTANVMAVVGDVMLSRDVGAVIRALDDPTAPFLETAQATEAHSTTGRAPR